MMELYNQIELILEITFEELILNKSTLQKLFQIDLK